MKTYVITLSKQFLSGHKEAGKPTNFRDKFLLGIGCPDCKTQQDLSGENISPCNSCIRACMYPKIHTMRSNYQLWESSAKHEKRIEESHQITKRKQFDKVMEIKGKVHLMFEQSGTFKNEFIKLGIPSEDYDIQNNFGQTDHVVDLFAEIEKAYDGKGSVFDSITKDDLIMAFFPCIYFESMQANYYQMRCNNLYCKSKNEQYEIVLERIGKREKFYSLLYKFFAVCDFRQIRMILENPATQPHYLLYPANFIPYTFVDMDRRKRGDYFKKPTAYWFFNCEPTNGKSFQKPKETKVIMNCKQGKESGICSEERSLISQDYARNFICDFIIGKAQKHTQLELF